MNREGENDRKKEYINKQTHRQTYRNSQDKNGGWEKGRKKVRWRHREKKKWTEIESKRYKQTHRETDKHREREMWISGGYLRRDVFCLKFNFSRSTLIIKQTNITIYFVILKRFPFNTI